MLGKTQQYYIEKCLVSQQSREAQTAQPYKGDV
jgi:hypothetical protein